MAYINLSYYKEMKDEIIRQLKAIRKASEDFGQAEWSELLTSTMEELEQETFKIVVVGEFSRGKSTFINALLGHKLLPSSVKPTTAILNQILYHSRPKFELVYRDLTREVEEVTSQYFQSVVAPVEPILGNVAAEKEYLETTKRNNEIAYAKIGFPLEVLKEQVVIIDTPGTNDLDVAREEITYQFIPQADAAIFILSAKQILTESEMNFLRNRILKNDISKIFFVINFKDFLTNEEQQKKILDYALEQLKRIVEHPKIFLVSSKNALLFRRKERGEEVKGSPQPLQETGLLELEKEMEDFLIRERGFHKLAKPVHRGQRFITDLLEQVISIEKATLGLSGKELEMKIEQMKPKLQKNRQAIQDISESLEAGLRLCGEKLKVDLHQELELIALTAVTTTQAYKGPLTKEAILSVIEQEVAPLQTRMQEEIQENLAAKFKCVVEKAYERYQKEWGKVEEVIQTMLETPHALKPALVSSTLVVRENELEFANGDDSSVAGWVGAGAGALGGILAGASFLLVPFLALGGGLFLHSMFEEQKRQKLLGQIQVQVEKRYYDRIPSVLQSFDEQFNKKTQDTVKAFTDEAGHKLSNLEQQFQCLQVQKKAQDERTEQRKQELLNWEMQLLHIHSNLENLLSFEKEPGKEEPTVGLETPNYTMG